MERKTFLKMTGASLIGAALAPEQLLAASNPKAKLAIQLYTIRDEIAKDLEGSIAKLARIGFRYVETAFWPEGITLKRAAAAIKAAGLKVCSCHIELPAGEQKKAFLETAEAFDCRQMIWHGWPEDKRYSNLEGTRDLIRVYNQTAAFARSQGLEFGLHNHWWEYRNKVGDKSVHEWLLAECDPRIFFELDTYWIKVAGYDPAEVISKFGQRARYVHIKDGPAKYNDKLAVDNPDPMVAVGKGAQNIPSIMRAQQSDYLVVEMDKVNGDPFEAIGESYRYLQQHFQSK